VEALEIHNKGNGTLACFDVWETYDYDHMLIGSGGSSNRQKISILSH
jgi:hypothetical protein